VRIVIAGGGEIGFALAQALAPGNDVFVIDHSADVGARFASLDVQFVLGNSTTSSVLQRAGTDRADVLVACTGFDEVNILSCAIARQIGSPQTICFVSREEFVTGEDDHGLASFGIDRIVWPEAQLAADIEGVIRTPGAIDAEAFVGGAVRLIEFRLDSDSTLTGQRIADLHFPHGSLIVAVRRDDAVFIPRGNSQLATGDRIIVMGTPDALQHVRERVTPGAEAGRQRVTIIGGGDVGLRIAERLDGDDAFQVTVIERSQARGEFLAARLRHALVLNGDGTDLELLEAEDVGRSHVLVSVIDNDERNLFASLLGRQLGIRRIITRVSRRPNLRLFERVGIDIAISARGAAVATVLHQILGGRTLLLAEVEQGAGRVLQLEVPAGYRSRTLRELDAPHNSIVGAIVRDGEAVVPRGNDRIQAGDRLIIFTTHSAADRVRNYFSDVRT
jgi:trk system potassium uptake protein TrkA